jgi:hypothetical protein
VEHVCVCFVWVVQAHRKEVDVVLVGLEVLVNLSSPFGDQVVLMEQLSLVRDALDTHSAAPDVVLAALKVLANLATCKGNRVLLAEDLPMVRTGCQHPVSVMVNTVVAWSTLVAWSALLWHGQL